MGIFFYFEKKNRFLIKTALFKKYSKTVFGYFFLQKLVFFINLLIFLKKHEFKAHLDTPSTLLDLQFITFM